MKAELKRQGSHAALPQAEPEDHERLCFSIERSQMKEVLDRSDSEEEIELFGDQDGQNLKIERELASPGGKAGGGREGKTSNKGLDTFVKEERRREVDDEELKETNEEANHILSSHHQHKREVPFVSPQKARLQSENSLPKKLGVSKVPGILYNFFFCCQCFCNKRLAAAASSRRRNKQQKFDELPLENDDIDDEIIL
mmetsp:Transcript_24061/g.38085  ORF Transcript_24061/g.38085 Transcript_24061/m.38085 type:complete len:198 (+) Transcript_24061:23-616(+)